MFISVHVELLDQTEMRDRSDQCSAARTGALSRETRLPNRQHTERERETALTIISYRALSVTSLVEVVVVVVVVVGRRVICRRDLSRLRQST